MKFLALFVFVLIVMGAKAKPSFLGHGAVNPGAVVVGPAGSIHVGPSSAGGVVPGVLGHGLWGHGLWGHGLWGHHGLWW